MNNTIESSKALMNIVQLLENAVNLEKKLQEIAAFTAKVLKTQRCSILLLNDSENSSSDPPYLSVFTHYGNLPQVAYQAPVFLDQSISGYVVTHKRPLLIPDIRQSSFVSWAKYLDQPNKSFISTPIIIDEQVSGVINVSFPLFEQVFTEEDLHLLEIFAAFVSKSLQINHLQMILRSKFVELAVSREWQENAIKEYLILHPNPNKLAKIVAKSFFRELTEAGFGSSEIISIATEVLSLLNNSLEKHRQRIARDEPS